MLDLGFDINRNCPRATMTLFRVLTFVGRLRWRLGNRELLNTWLATLEGTTMLHDALEHSNYAVVKMLLDNGARLDIKNKLGLTPVDIANNMGCASIIKALARHQANTGS
jgi:ankyrin repeat protein